MKSIAAARAVRDGRALWERDSVLFQAPAANWPVLSCLLRFAARHNGRLNVVDFGGAFGSLWWQHRRWLEGVATRWMVIEQSSVVDAGNSEFANETLGFTADVHHAVGSCEPNILVLSSVLPYLEKPLDLLQELVTFEAVDTVILDRTGFVSDRNKDRLTVQTVPPVIYKASYPCWFLSRARLDEVLERKFNLLCEWSNDDAVNIPAEYRGMLWERRMP